MDNTLRGWLAQLTIGPKKGGKILVLNSAGSYDLNKIYKEMEKEITGVKHETIVHVTTLFLRIVAQLIVNGFSVNTGLFRAVAGFTGVIEKGVWNPDQNSVNVNFIPDKVLRDAIRNTQIEIQSEKPNTLYILEVEDRLSGNTNGKITPGHNVFVRGSRIKVVGTDKEVGVSFTHSDGTIIKLVDDGVTINNPSELTLLLPSDMKDGDYEMKIVTQYSGSAMLLKEPHVVTKNVRVGDEENERPDEV